MWIVLKFEISNFSLPKKFKKKKLFAIGPVIFAPGTQTCATELTNRVHAYPNV
jgi:hypothetical protein